MRLKILITLALMSILLIFTSPTHAHASLIRSSPSANSILDEPPAEIRLWFTEPLESDYSFITLRDTSGEKLAIDNAQVDSNDSYQLFVILEPLPHGVYTVVWSVVSSADGHPTSGSFSFSVGGDSTTASVLTNLNEESSASALPFSNSMVRWLNLLSISFLLGVASFYLLVMKPTIADETNYYQGVFLRLFWVGWLAVGLSSILLLISQSTIVNNISFFEALDLSQLGAVATQTRFGELWVIRSIFWLTLGAMLVLNKRNELPSTEVLGLMAGILILQTLNSHAQGAPDQLPALILDWLHLLTASLWLGGLSAFLIVGTFILAVNPSAKINLLGKLTARFSLWARLWVGLLFLSGIYASWLHVGSLDGLIETTYGQLLVAKIVLFVLLVSLAGINLFKTQRELQTGNPIWTKRLIQLIGLELSLGIAILALVGAMTAIQPARSVIAQENVQTETIFPEAQPIIETVEADGMTIEFHISSAWAGSNQFTLKLIDKDSGFPISNIALIRLQFKNVAASITESEINPTRIKQGVYGATGTNISLPGDWQIRAIIQRPNEYDTLIDFDITAYETPEPSLQTHAPDLTIPLAERRSALVLVGISLLIWGWAVIKTLRGIGIRHSVIAET